jgi:ketosteroid isomerase-like protein
VPFVAHSAAERAVIAAYQSLETASANADMETYAARLADELLIVNTQYRGTPTTKPAAYAVHEHQKETHTTGAPAPLQWAHISIFGDTAIMDSRQGSAKGQANAPVNLILRVWVDRDGRWQLAYSHQTLKLGSALK